MSKVRTAVVIGNWPFSKTARWVWPARPLLIDLFYAQIVNLIQGIAYHSVIIGDIPSVFMI